MTWLFVLNLFLTPSLAHDACTNKQGNTNAWNSLRNIASLIEQSCEIKPNTPTVVQGRAGPLARNYKLTKTSDNNFIAEINLQFVDERGGKVARSADIRKTSDSFRPKIQKCLDEYNPYFKGPNGETLTIKQTYAVDVVQRINIADIGARANSRVYPEDITCTTAIHEILHLLGLVDEYEEKQRGYITDKTTGQAVLVAEGAEIPRYDCRALGPKDSIMSYHNNAVAAVRPTYEFDTCACNTRNKAHSEILDCQNRNKELNERGQRYTSCPHDMLRQTFKTQGTAREDTILYLGEPRVIPPKRESLLQPAHFRLITNPNCVKLNQGYRECANFSYQTSIELPTKSCGPTSENCKQNYNWLQ